MERACGHAVLTEDRADVGLSNAESLGDLRLGHSAPVQAGNLNTLFIANSAPTATGMNPRIGYGAPGTQQALPKALASHAKLGGDLFHGFGICAQPPEAVSELGIIGRRLLPTFVGADPQGRGLS